MRELTYYVAVSLDGFIAATDGTFDAFLAEGDHMEAVVSDHADALPAHVLNALGIEPPQTRFDTVIQGWNSYSVALDVGSRTRTPTSRSTSRPTAPTSPRA
jgi:hypothetical protein